MRFSCSILAIAWLAFASGSQAAYIITATESGGDVLFDGSGELNLNALSGAPGGFGAALLGPSVAMIVIGGDDTAPSAPFDHYTGAITPSGPFGPGSGGSFNEVPTGDIVGYTRSSGNLGVVVPRSYSPGDPLASTALFSGETFVSLGMTPGSYTWSWGSGADADFIRLNIVPEPSAAALALLAACAVAGHCRASRKSCGRTRTG